MGRGWSIAAGLWLAFAAACGPSAFACEDDGQCANAAEAGFCEPSGYCSFPAEDCDSGRKYGRFAPGELAGACVPTADESSGSSSASGTSTSGANPGNTTLDPPTGGSTSTTNATATSTTDPVDDPTTSGGDDDATTDPTTGDASTGGVATSPTFVDAFERPDGEDVGNDWIEKDPAAFGLAGGSVVVQGPINGGYADHVVYRPFAESLLDVEVVMELEFSDVAPPGHPQVHARVQAGDIEPAGSVSCYLLYIEDGDLLEITRQESGSFARRENVPIASPPNAADHYRLRLRVEGTDPVMLDGYLERLAGDDWLEEAHIGFEDAQPTRIVDPGSFGFSGHTELDHYDYLRFTADAL